MLDPHETGKHARWWSHIFNSGIKEIEIVYQPGKENACAEAEARVLLCEVNDIKQLLALNPEKDTPVIGFSMKEDDAGFPL